MTDESRAVELHAQLRELALPWETGHQLAVATAIQTVHDMREAFNKSAETDPYETGITPPDLWDLNQTGEDDPSVRLMTGLFISILNRRGLLKIDLTVAPTS